jgi:hypothetical protein
MQVGGADVGYTSDKTTEWEAHHKPESRAFETRLGEIFINLYIHSSRTRRRDILSL